MNNKRMCYGGNGSHWEGCEDSHWDCAIFRLEERVKVLESRMIHCPDCGGDYVSTGVEVGCNCKLIKEIKELQDSLEIANKTIESLTTELLLKG